MERYKEIERSIIKKYRKEIWSKFIKAIKEYELIKLKIDYDNDISFLQCFKINAKEIICNEEINFELNETEIPRLNCIIEVFINSNYIIYILIVSLIKPLVNEIKCMIII